MNKIQKIIGLFVLMTAAGTVGWYLASDIPVTFELPTSLRNAILSSPKPIEPFQLITQQEIPFSERQLRGRWSWIFVGYTHCPDICPTTLATLKSVAMKLPRGKKSELNQFIFVTVDPKRDTAQHLKQYLGYFSEEFIGLTGTPDEIDSLVQQLGTIYAIEGDASGDNYIVNHSATIALIDPEGRYYAKLNPPFTAEKLIETFERIRNFYDS
jgi:protein SCO1/2